MIGSFCFEKSVPSSGKETGFGKESSGSVALSTLLVNVYIYVYMYTTVYVNFK